VHLQGKRQGKRKRQAHGQASGMRKGKRIQADKRRMGGRAVRQQLIRVRQRRQQEEGRGRALLSLRHTVARCALSPQCGRKGGAAL
jgi:hypothetical protein